jgi:hypothetical protein
MLNFELYNISKRRLNLAIARLKRYYKKQKIEWKSKYKYYFSKPKSEITKDFLVKKKGTTEKKDQKKVTCTFFVFDKKF